MPLEEVDEFNIVKKEDSEDVLEESESSSTESEKEEEGVAVSQEKTTSQGDSVIYDDLKLDPSSDIISADELNDDDVELWLVRIPTHDTLIESICGKSFSVVEDGPQQVSRPRKKSRVEVDGYGEKRNRLKGSYYFRDHGLSGLDTIRAVSVVKTDTDEAGLCVGML